MLAVQIRVRLGLRFGLGAVGGAVWSAALRCPLHKLRYTVSVSRVCSCTTSMCNLLGDATRLGPWGAAAPER